MATLYADAHVHVYPCFDRGALLGGVLARARGLDGRLSLLFCESSGFDVFSELAHTTRSGPSRLEGGLELRSTSEPISLEVRSAERGVSVFLISGRQLLSSEGIEVLALGLDPESPLTRTADRSRPADWLLEQALESSPVAVLPWGAGKWTGARGRRVARLADQARFSRHPGFFLGDVAQRCWPWREPALFGAHRVLCGTDPLPVPGAERRVALYGTRVDAPFVPQAPAGSLFAALRATAALDRFGRRETLLRTVREQVAYRRSRSTRARSRGASCATTC